MIRSSKITLNSTNTGKRDSLIQFVDSYQKTLSQFIDLLWNEKEVPKFIPKSITSQVNSFGLSARALQATAKQAGGIVRGTCKKMKQRQWRLKELTKSGRFDEAQRLQEFIAKHPISKP